MFKTVMNVIFWPFTLLGTLFDIMGSVFSRMFGIAAVLVITGIILGGFKLLDKVKGPKEEELASGDGENFSSYYQQQK